MFITPCLKKSAIKTAIRRGILGRCSTKNKQEARASPRVSSLHRNQRVKTSSVASKRTRRGRVQRDESKELCSPAGIPSAAQEHKNRPTWNPCDLRCTEFNEGVPHHRPQTRPAASHPNTVDATFDCPTSAGGPREDRQTEAH